MRALPLMLAALVGCSTSESSATTDASGDSSTDGATTCFLCGDAQVIDASLGVRAINRLDSCNGIEGCHVSGAANLTFITSHELDVLVDVPSSERPGMVRVKRGDPSASYLYLKVLGDGGIDGSVMPKDEAYDPAIPKLFFDWIEAGAPKQ